MKKFALGMLAAVAMTGSAAAADLAARPYTKAPAPVIAAAYDWSGFYLGINGGGGWSHKCWDRTAGRNTLFVTAIAEGCHDASGGTIGGQVGYRWQAGNWVFGLEGQGNWADFTGSNPSLFFGNVTNRTKVDAFGMVTGQIGYTWNNVLGYVKGGAAVTHDKYDGVITNTGFVFDRATETRWGGAIGAGLEYGFAPNWSVAVEYDHLFMGSRNLILTSTIVPGALSRGETIRQDVDMVTARINYRFGGPVVARY
jgi:outer membrane immunogenic protein